MTQVRLDDAFVMIMPVWLMLDLKAVALATSLMMVTVLLVLVVTFDGVAAFRLLVDRFYRVPFVVSQLMMKALMKFDVAFIRAIPILLNDIAGELKAFATQVLLPLLMVTVSLFLLCELVFRLIYLKLFDWSQ